MDYWALNPQAYEYTDTSNLRVAEKYVPIRQLLIVGRIQPTAPSLRWRILAILTDSRAAVAFDMIPESHENPRGALTISSMHVAEDPLAFVWFELRMKRKTTVDGLIDVLRKSHVDDFIFSAGGLGSCHWVTRVAQTLEAIGLAENLSFNGLWRFFNRIEENDESGLMMESAWKGRFVIDDWN